MGLEQAGRRRTVAVGLTLALVALVASACSSTNAEGGATGVADAAVETTVPPEVEVGPTPTAVSTAPAKPSAGCGNTEAAPPSGPQADQKLTVDGVERTYRLFVPPNAGLAKPLPLVLNIHGLTSNIAEQVAVSGLEELAATEGFVVLTPQGLGSPAKWGFMNDPANPDLPFFSAVLDSVEATRCIDTARVYSTGISNGGMMSATLACQMGERIAAVGLVSGIREPNGCTPAAAVTPVMVFWGKNDLVLPFYGGLGPVLTGKGEMTPPTAPPAELGGFPPVEQVVGEWADHDGCDAEPTTFTVGSDVEERVFSGCRDEAQVRFYVVSDGGHTWPGSKVLLQLGPNGALGVTTDQVDASALIWQFFKGYALQG